MVRVCEFNLDVVQSVLQMHCRVLVPLFAQTERDATRCSAKCGQALPCGHLCDARCGACAAHKQAQGADDEQHAADAAIPLSSHVPCRQTCSRLLVCGHPCTSLCHPATEPCSDCSRACPMRCVHGKCSLGCSQVTICQLLDGGCSKCNWREGL